MFLDFQKWPISDTQNRYKISRLNQFKIFAKKLIRFEFSLNIQLRFWNALPYLTLTNPTLNFFNLQNKALLITKYYFLPILTIFAKIMG